jgi:hypothetical protein
MPAGTYRDSKPNAAPAAIEVAQIALSQGGIAFRRDLGDATVEVLTMDSGRLQRHVVAADGTSTLIDSARRTKRYARGLWMLRIGFGLWFAMIVGGGIAAPDGNLAGAAAFLLLFSILLAIPLILGGARITGNENVARWLETNGDPSERWMPVALLRLSGSGELTTDQVAAAETIAGRYGDVLAGRLPDGTTEVVAFSSGRLYRYHVTERGDTMQVERSALSPLYVVAIVFALGGFLVAGALWISHLANGWWLVLGALGGYAVGVTLAWGSEADYRRLRRTQEWVRFKAPPED